MDYRSKFPLHGIILCSRTGHTHIYLQPDRNGCRIEPYCVLEQDTRISTCNHTETVVELNLIGSRTGHTYIYLQPYRNGCRIEPLLCSRTDTHIFYLQQTEMVVELNSYCVLEQTHIHLLAIQMEMVVEWNPYG